MTSIAAHPMISTPGLADLLPSTGSAIDAGSFQRTLTSVQSASKDSDSLREAATQFVSTAFVVPVLASLRESPFNDGPFAPGVAERRFGPLLDQHFADNVVSSQNFALVDSLIERTQRTSAAAMYGARGGTNG